MTIDLTTTTIGGSGDKSNSSTQSSHYGIDQYFGYLPIQLLRQVAGEYFPPTTTDSSNPSFPAVVATLQHPPKLTSVTPTVSTTTTNSTIKRKRSSHRRWAYAYLMAGVNVLHPGYRGILYNVLVSAEFLKNSRADVVLMVQMAHNSPLDRLLPIEQAWLEAMNVTVKYLDLPDHGVQNFYTVQLEKFHILEWTEYSRVLFMDGDVLPFCDMDYLFELSDPPTGTTDPLLKQNLIIAWTLEPAHGGFFMLTPNEGDFQELEDIVRRREDQVHETGILFDEKLGWGHAIEHRGWRAAVGARTNTFLWDWHGDFVDQGLLYYWTKYYKQDVSIVINNEVENWTSKPLRPTNNNETTSHQNGTLTREIFLERTLQQPFDEFTCVKGKLVSRPRRYSQVQTGSRGEQWDAPYRDFIHFSGKFKPWLEETQQKMDLDDIVNRTWNSGTETLDALRSPQELWYYTFWKIHQRLRMGDSPMNSSNPFHSAAASITKRLSNNQTVVQHWKAFAMYAPLLQVDIRNLEIPKLALGGYPTYNMMKDVMKARTGRSTDHIEGWKEIENRKKAQRKYTPF
ncbi:glycosyl transferase family 8 protein [Nitzschia inconspicua]|uniref:Glycosyl transferase family 8 protein n=1 Tax=Nitzschia inconspicua TaxID=303405 RepID=A0A9K3KJ75_9STRA|nr:glycosyl transferase family 8 protein [Nitzschia inconspicua]